MRLTREQVEASSKEMWDAIAHLPGDDDHEGRQTLIDQARAIEAKLQMRLAAQDRLDAAAPLLLDMARRLQDLIENSRGPAVVLPSTVLDLLDKAIRLADGHCPPIGYT